MADVVNTTEGAPPKLPRIVSALRSSRPTPKRVQARVAIAIPENPTTNDDVTKTATSTSPNLSVRTTPWAKSLILTLDGGDIRSYSSLITLRALMKAIAKIEQNLEPKAASSAQTDRIDSDKIPDHVFRKGQYLPCHYFDYIAGTSVGGLIAIMLGMLEKSADDCITEFQRQNESIPLPNDAPVVGIEFQLLNRRSTWPTGRTRSFFDTFAKFSATATARARPNLAAPRESAPEPNNRERNDAASVATSEAAEFKKDSLQCQTLAWCTEVEDHSERRPYAFASYKEEDQSEKLVSIPEVAKAITTPSSAAFKPFKLGSGQFVDGSKQIRDPTLEVLKEITALLSEPGEPPIDLLLSLGTDEHHAWFYKKLRKPLAGPVTSPSQADITKEEGKSYLHYHRFEVTDIKLGLRKKYFLREIEEATEKWLAADEQQALIRQYAEMLVERRRARANTSRWETFALGARYYCFHERCRSADKAFDSRGDFHEHLDRRHRLSKEAARGTLDIEQELDKGRKFGCT